MFTELEQRSWIKIEMAQSYSTQECFQALLEACGDTALPYHTVARWVNTRTTDGTKLSQFNIQLLKIFTN